MQQKDVIYIDVEDDITAIIGKVKESKEAIVALVPPKRTGVLQSAVNLRLLARTADNADKKLILITGSQALSQLAANAKIPVAKNLQSRPEIAELKSFADNDDDDVIEGDQLPVGDHAKLASEDAEDMIIPAASIDGIDIDDKPKAAAAAKKPKKGIKVPDFGTFRRKMAFGIVGVIVLILFLIWAIVFAPDATIVISAKTTPVNIKTQLSIADNLQNDASKGTITSTTETDKSTMTADVTPTGTKDVGTKATGSVTFSNCQSHSSLTVNAGTYLSSGGNNYILQSTVVVPGGQGDFSCNSPGVSAPVAVAASDIGSDYNLPAGSDFTVAGFGSQMTATSSAGISGGDKHSARVATVDDVQNALNSLKEQNTDSEKAKLTKKFPDGTKIIDDSFSSNMGDPKVTPNVGDEIATGNGKLSVDVTYTMVGVAQASLDDFLKDAIGDQVSTDSQRIYDSGASSASFSGYQASSDSTKPATVQLSANGQVGPKIDDNQIKDQEKGKRSGEVQGDLRAIDGVSDVDVQLSPFWVSGVPNDVHKITIQFKLISNG